MSEYLPALVNGNHGHVGLQQNPVGAVFSLAISLSECPHTTVVLLLVLLQTDRAVSVLEESLSNNQRLPAPPTFS